MTKEFLSYDTIRDNAVKLACRIYREFGIPDIIYVSLRGGAAMGNVLSECLQILSPGKKVLYAAVVARSYRDVGAADPEVRVDGWTYRPDLLTPGDRVLFVDDIFDTGRTVNHLVGLILARGIVRSHIAVAVHDYKIRAYEPHPLPVTPDFFSRRHVLRRPEEDFWIHYLSHELKSLTEEEIAEHYTGQDEELKKVFALLRSFQRR